jgi:type IV pilus secretin PilQ/predicted competence protein
MKTLILILAFLSGWTRIAAQDSSVLDNRLTMNFKDADILSILRLLSKQNDLNLVANKDVRGKITVHFNEVRLEEALETILKANGYDYYIERDIIFVKPMDSERSSTMTTRVFDLQYVDAFDLKETLTSFMSKRGKVEALSRSRDGVMEEKRSSMLVVSDLDYHVRTIDSVIRRLDQPQEQIMIEIRMYETALGDDQNVGVGLPTAITGKTFDARNPDDPGTITDYTALAPLEDKLQNLIMGKLSVDRLVFSLNFLKTQTNSKLLSNPKILTLNHQKAEISVGTTVPVRTISRSAAGDIITFTDKNVNVHLKVTPRIHPDSTITLLIEPTIEDIIGYVGEGDNRQPIISSRKARTQVVVKNEESIVLGGLLKEIEVDETSKVWLLGDIPLLGKLFTTTSKEKKKTDLLIFITPQIIRSTAAVR